MEKTSYKFNLTLSLIFLVMFFITTMWFDSGTSQSFDIDVYNFIVSIRNKNLNGFMLAITNLASLKIVIVICLILLFVPISNKKYGLHICLLSLLQFILNTVVKITFKRARIQNDILVFEKSYSFPSAHTMTAIVVYGILIYLCYKNIKNHSIRNFIIFILMLIVMLVIFSRVYLGAHYFSDVLAATFLGLSFLFVSIKFLYI